MVNQDVLVVGGGLAGMQAALVFAASGYNVVIAEKEKELGGHVKEYGSLFPDMSEGKKLVAEKVSQVKSHSNITVKTETEVTDAERIEGGIKATIASGGASAKQDFGAVIFAGGFTNYDGTKYGEYGYGRYPGVIAGIDFEQNTEEILKKPIKTALFIKCVGSRDRSKGMPYCSKLCCMYTAKQAKEIKEAYPDADVYVTYMDIRANFKNGEEFVRSVQENERVRYLRGRVARVYPNITNGRLNVRVEDTLMCSPLEIETDLVVLATAIMPIKSTNALVEKLGGKVDENGFVPAAPIDQSSNPMEVAEGVFYAGTCAFPSDVRETLSQGAAAAAGVVSYLKK